MWVEGQKAFMMDRRILSRAAANMEEGFLSSGKPGTKSGKSRRLWQNKQCGHEAF